MTHVTCRLTAKNRDQVRNPILGNRVWANFTFTVLSDWLGRTSLKLSLCLCWLDWLTCVTLSVFYGKFILCCSVFTVYLCMSALVVVIILISWGRSSVIGKEQRLWNCLLSCWLWSESCDCVLPRAGSGAQWALDLIFSFGAIYIACLLIWYASTLITCSSLLPYLSPPLLVFSFGIDPLHFKAGCR